MSSHLDQIIGEAKTLLAQCIVAANKAAVAAAQASSFGYAPLNSPAFMGEPTAPSPLAGDASTRIATTAWMTALFGVANGVATLGPGGIIPVSQLPFSGLTNDGSWDANSNTPTLVSGSGTAGHFYVVSVAGATNLDGVTTWNVGDWALFSGSVWQRIPVPEPALSNIPLSALAGQANDTVVAQTAGGTASPTAVAIASLTSKLSLMIGASAGTAGTAGIVPAPNVGDQAKFLRGDATYQTVPVPDLSAYALLNSPAFTGTATVVTQARNVNSTAIASAAFVISMLATAAEMVPKVDGTASCGTSTYGARIDHIHPTDTSRAALMSPAFAGVPTAPTAARATNTVQLATMAAVIAQLSTAAEIEPLGLTGTASCGTSTYGARIDHIHPATAPTKAPGDNSVAIATTAFVAAALAGVGPVAGSGITVTDNIVSINTDNHYGIGSYAMGNAGAGGIAGGATTANFVAKYWDSGSLGWNTEAVAGTWRNMGPTTAAGNDVGLYMRVS